ncbi:MAG: insulinase family protein [Pseudomonadales bacterium]|nr:insulinase family protein [Pseudomonadales bacterium]
MSSTSNSASTSSAPNSDNQSTNTSATGANLTSKQCHPSFQWLRSEPIESLHVTVSEYRHNKTGAMHYHIAADNDENVFLVALRTIPTDSTGVAHILEHTALCGSEAYPVRDPFFMMIRRSLNTFMNAFTSSDWTAYPFASKNRKDFDNLSNVYLDAVFFSRLDPLDFAQEGHRLEFEETENSDSPLVYKGVVYNEMKGAMSSPVSVLWDAMGRHLFPSSTYHHNSGGDPEAIPNLSYEQLKAFYQTHYHPSNAVFITYGDISAQAHQEKFEERALKRFEPLERKIAVLPEKRFNTPKKIEEPYAHQFQEGESVDNKTHILLAWLLGESTDLESQLKAHLLSDVLLDNSAAPLRQLLETCGLGSAPSPLCGLEDSNLEMTFMCGLEGSSPQAADELEARIYKLFEELSVTGVPQEHLEASLHQLELSQREVGGDHYPYGLQLIMSAISPAMHRGDPIALLNLDPVLEKLRADIKDPAFIKTLIKSQLLQNQHRIRLVLVPDDTLENTKAEEVRQRLDTVQQQLSTEEKQGIIDQSKALLERQAQEDDISVLPKVGIEDVPPNREMPKGSTSEFNQHPLFRYEQGTNGLVYQQIVTPIPELEDGLLDLLPLYTRLIGDLGAGSDDYLSIQNKITATTGGIGAFSTMRGAIDDEQDVNGFLVYSGKALSRNNEALADLISCIVQQGRFDELERIRELVAQQRARAEDSITGNGHSLAMMAAASGLSPAADLAHQLSGLAGIKSLQALDNSLKDPKELENLADRLTVLHNLLQLPAKQFLVVGEADSLQNISAHLEKRWPGCDESLQAFKPASVRENRQQTWFTNTQVNFCAKAYGTVPSDHADAPVLSVLSGFLRNGYLHRVIREQGGAYGGGATQDSNNASFRFYSYRDPRLTGTLEDFDKSVAWLLGKDHGYQPLEEAILGVIGSLDKPGSPAGEAKQAYQNLLFGRDDAFQARFRDRVLKTTEADLKRVAATYFKPENASTAIITNKTLWEQAKLDGFEFFEV